MFNGDNNCPALHKKLCSHNRSQTAEKNIFTCRKIYSSTSKNVDNQDHISQNKYTSYNMLNPNQIVIENVDAP